MFQSILERIIVKYFGEYLLEIDKKNIAVAIWNGSLKIEGIQLNPAIFNQLDLPIKLKYSWIGSLEIIVPWSKLSVLPVEIKIRDIFLIISPLEKIFWLNKLNRVENKISIIEETLRECLNPAKKNNKSTIFKNYLDLFIAKIVDNIQINIENIHIRLENRKKESSFVFGLSLKQVSIETKDPSWTQKIFYDRTNPKNKDRPINKQIIVKNLGVYLIPNSKKFFNELKTKEEIKEKMNIFKEEISEKSKKKFFLNYALDICLDLKVTINFDNNYFTIPEYKIELNVDLLNINIKYLQIQETIRILEFFNEFDFFLAAMRRDFHYFLSEKPVLPTPGSLTKRNKSKLVKNLWNYCGEVVIFEIRKSNFIRYLTNHLSTNQKNLSLKTRSTDSNFQKLSRICQKTSIDYLKLWFNFYLFI